MSNIREFPSGATRDTDEGKADFEGFLSPAVLERFGEYMHKHRRQANGTLRDSDNWQKGIPKSVLMKSLIRHVMDCWMMHRGFEGREPLEEALCAVLFNTSAYLLEVLKERDYRRELKPR